MARAIDLLLISGAATVFLQNMHRTLNFSSTVSSLWTALTLAL
jgi:hypothetical protein